MASDAQINVEKDVTSNVACARSQWYMKDSVFWLAQMTLCVVMLRNFPPFVDLMSFWTVCQTECQYVDYSLSGYVTSQSNSQNHTTSTAWWCGDWNARRSGVTSVSPSVTEQTGMIPSVWTLWLHMDSRRSFHKIKHNLRFIIIIVYFQRDCCMLGKSSKIRLINNHFYTPTSLVGVVRV